MKKKKNASPLFLSKEAEERKTLFLNAVKIQALLSQSKITLVETSRLVH